jgi:hypothetical protein
MSSYASAASRSVRSTTTHAGVAHGVVDSFPPLPGGYPDMARALRESATGPGRVYRAVVTAQIDMMCDEEAIALANALAASEKDASCAAEKVVDTADCAEQAIAHAVEMALANTDRAEQASAREADEEAERARHADQQEAEDQLNLAKGLCLTMEYVDDHHYDPRETLAIKLLSFGMCDLPTALKWANEVRDRADTEDRAEAEAEAADRAAGGCAEEEGPDDMLDDMIRARIARL